MENTHTFVFRNVMGEKATLNFLSWVRMGIWLLTRLFSIPFIELKYYCKHFLSSVPGAWHAMCEIVQKEDSEVSKGQKVWRLNGHGKDLGFYPKRNREPFRVCEQDSDISRWTFCKEYLATLWRINWRVTHMRVVRSVMCGFLQGRW